MTNPVTPEQHTLPADDEVFVFPASSAQQRLWLLDQLAPSSTYNIRFGWRIRGPLHQTALEQSLAELVWRQESLRTSLAQIDEKLMQVIDSNHTVPLTLVDVPHLPPEERETEVMRLATEEAERPFDLSRGPLLRTTLLRLEEQEHLLLVTVHHAVADGWSMGVFAKELSELYTAYAHTTHGADAANEGQSPLPELAIQYVDYVAWHEQWLQGATLDKLLAFWQKQLGGELPVLQLPTDRPRPAVQTYRGANLAFKVAKPLCDRLTNLCKGVGVTPYMALLAAFKTLLFRYTGQADILVGSPIAGRKLQEIENVIGLFMNTVVLRTDLSGGITFRELLARVRETALDAHTHQDMPFERLVEAVQPERNLSHSPLFQVMFILQNTPPLTLDLPDLTTTVYEPGCQTSKFDLTLIVEEREGDMLATFEFNVDLFDHATIERMSQHLFTLLEAACENPDQLLTHLPLLTSAERQQILVEWNDTSLPVLTDSCIHHLFEEQVIRTPDALAVIFEGESLTYRELNQRANQLAHLLQKMGIGSGSLVGVCMERSLTMIVGLLGVLKAGGAYVPLDPSYPRERLAFMAEDAGVQVLVTQSELFHLFEGQGLVAVCVDTAFEALAGESDANLPHTVTADNLAYVIYTSGSTGKPKGVLIEHRSVVNFFAGMDQRVGCTGEDAMLALTSIGFDISVLELFWTLTRGCKVVILSDREKVESGSNTDADYSLTGQIRSQGITMLQCTPSLMKMIVTHGEGLDALQNLRTILLGGEAMPPVLAKTLREHLPTTRLLNMYGPTEATIWATTHEVTDAGQLISIGKPIANTEAYVLDPHLQPLPVGVSGELHIGGVQLARGYLNRPDLTEEKFVAHPFSSKGGARLYKTGDVARFLPDGTLDILGRIDHQVKLRGFRIELGEIEAALTADVSVREAVVIVREDVPGDQRLVAYLVAAEGQVPEPNHLRHTLKVHLPDYMVPALFVLLDHMPLTPNGKIDRKALPVPTGEGESQLAPPTTPLQIELATIWCELLTISSVGIHDSFFALGGHSLLATQLISRVRATFHVELTLRHLFDASTIAELAHLIEQEQGQTVPKTDSAITPIARRPRR